jgi:peptidoglycan/LPS O-acetylase OafA/YrhL
MKSAITTPIPSSSPAGADSTHALSGSYNLSVGYLRAFITLLVIAHHAVLAYHPYVPPPLSSLLAQPRSWQWSPVVDAQRWTGFSFFVGFNDIFFMSLMFFLSGLFVYKSLERKGVKTFLRDRLLRLGLPFVVAAVVVAPLAYYPSYLQTSSSTGFAGFWQQWTHLGMWPAGPAWFIWLLLAFDVVAAIMFALAPNLVTWLGRVALGASVRPVLLFLLVVGASAVTYIPMAARFTAERWSAWGLFAFQNSRLLHYFVYFLIAIAAGATAMPRGLFASDGKLARRWPLWTSAMAAIYFALAAAFIAMLSGAGKSLPWTLLLGGLWVLSCAASCFAFMSLFSRFATRRAAAFDSLTANAYGMYLIHYAFVSWLQYGLLRVAMPGLAKGTLVTLAAIALSWATISALRKIPAVARVI